MSRFDKLKYLDWSKLDKIILRSFVLFCVSVILIAVGIAVLDKIGVIESQYIVIE